MLLFFRPDLRRQGLIPAFLFIPYGPISELLYFRDYWLPEPILPQFMLFGQSFLTEDLLFAFGTVGFMSIAYDIALRRRPREGLFPRYIGSAVVLSLLAMGIFILGSLYTPLNSILVGALVAIIFAIPMLILRPDLFRVALGSSLLLGFSTICFYAGILSIPGGIDYLIDVWKLPLATSAFYLGTIPIPLTEVMWAFTTAFYYSIVYKFAMGSGYEPVS